MNKIKEQFVDKKVLITGGAGFIGSSLALVLCGMGARVTVLDALLPLYGGNLFNLDAQKNKIKFIKGDIRDKQLILELVKGQDFIFNLAAQVSYIDSKVEPFLDLDINCLGHLNILEAVVANPGAKVIFSSSRMVYGKIITNPVQETHPTEPLSIYGIHKLTAEKYYQYYNKTFGVDTVVARIPNPYGPRQQMKHNKYSIVGWFMRQAFDGETITIFGDGNQQRDYLYIDDIIEALLLLAVFGRSGEIYNLGTKERVTLLKMIDVILDEIGTGKKEHVPWPENYKKNETGNYVADTTKIESDTGWQAKVKLREGVKKMADYYKENKNKYW